MSEILSERIAVIGASTTGKTYFVCKEILPHFKYIHLFGPLHNIQTYVEAMRKDAKIQFHSDKEDLNLIMNNAEDIKRRGATVCQLIIFDDFITDDFVNSLVAKRLFATGRHGNLSMVILSQTPNIIVSPFMKMQMSQFVICEYSASKGFETLMEEFFYNIIAEQHMDSDNILRDTKKHVREILADTFQYKYAKLVIKPLTRQWFTVIPKERIKKENGFKPQSIIGTAISAASNKGVLPPERTSIDY